MVITLDTFLLMLAQGFVQRAFIIGIVVAFLSSLLSIFIVLKRISLIGDGLAHTAFGGLALGYYLDILPLWVAGVVVILGSIGITKVTRSSKVSGDAAVAIFLQLGLASGIVLLSLSRGFGVNLESLLFGSILLVSIDQILSAVLALAITSALVLIFFKELVYTTFDETQAKAAGIKTWFFDYLVSILAGMAIIVSIPIVGVLLISALLVLPAVTSTQISGSFKQTVILSPLFGLLSVILGLCASIILDTASGATIVLVGLILFLISLFAKNVIIAKRYEARQVKLGA
ncbi:MAG: metal ABC transporter permease [Candidatus Bathyarchaeia archaeon]|jgi:zinc transport system permease protein